MRETRELGYVTRYDGELNRLSETLLNPSTTSTIQNPLVGPAPSGGFAAVSTIKPTAGSTGNAYIQTFFADGSAQWIRQLDVNTGSDDAPTIYKNDDPFVTTGEGNLWIAGTTLKNGVRRWFLAKYSPAGAFQFVRTGENDTRPTALVFDGGGWPILAYRIESPTGPVQNRLIRFNPTGVQQWRTGYNPNLATGQSASIYDIAMVSGALVAVGYTGVSGTSRPMFAVFNPSTGARTGQLIRTTLPGSFYKVHAASASSFFATGQQDASGTGILSSYNDASAGGFHYWTRKYSPSPSAIVNFVDSQTDEYENLYVLGSSYSPAGPAGRKTLIGRYLFNGTVRWTVAHGPDTAEYEPAGFRVNSFSGQVFVAGSYMSAAIGRGSTLFLNQPATATSKDMFGERDTVLTGGAGFNDIFARGGTFNLVSPPNQGTLSLQPSGFFTYTPPAAWTGVTSFTYTVSRPGVSTSNVGTVNITISAP